MRLVGVIVRHRATDEATAASPHMLADEGHLEPQWGLRRASAIACKAHIASGRRRRTAAGHRIDLGGQAGKDRTDACSEPRRNEPPSSTRINSG